MRELDRKAIEEYKIPGLILMENAGRNVAEEVLKMTDDPQRTKVAILCGKGNNGGDGYVVARHLHNHHVPVDVFLVANISDILKDGDAGTNLQILLPMKIPIREILGITEIASVLKELGSYDIIIDALFGTGLSGEVRQPFKTLIEGVNNLNKPIVSVDIPSGLDCNNGNILGAAMKATKTVTFAASKRGFYLGNGPVHTGKIIITDISIPKELLP
ncbi:MAG: NAD(P)H-hydrate epimerase [Candidatus Brocadia sp. AMX1]|nr:NAD(P)H-hydrate epimerase [Candidatus Brocadia sp. AMX1]